jgi:3-oxoadipate enol-lactonase
MPTLTINGNAVFYAEFGDPALPPLVLLHGLYGDSTTVESLAKLLDRFHVIAPDALGHGRSARPVDFTLEDQGRMLCGLVHELGYPSAVLVGVSMGSYLAQQAAILEPATWSSLILIVSKAHGQTSSVAAYAKRRGFDLATAAPEDMLEFMAGAVWSPDTSQERRDQIMAQQSTTAVVLGAEEQAAVEKSLRGFDLRPLLPSVTTPTLVISGRSDGLNPPESGEEVASHLPNSRFEIYEHSGHMLTAEEPDRLVADVNAFVFGN